MHEDMNYLIIRKTAMMGLTNLHSNVMVYQTRISLLKIGAPIAQTLQKVLAKLN
jgi:hypothetical protein